jgi:hypothetical protein
VAIDRMPPVWHDVPLEQLPNWSRVFDVSDEGLDLSVSCPVWGATQLHRWFEVYRPGRTSHLEKMYQGSGAQWQWCSCCHSYEHSSGLVPGWWRSPFSIEIELLRHDPGPIEAERLAQNNGQ